MKPNYFGFMYPSTDENSCVRCGKCVAVCAFKRRVC
ncbi:4Fe-4S binding protein [Senegalimassilia anaerobia]